MKIVLIGYMASGKSAVGQVLADVLEYQFIDLDDYIQSEENLTISEIFSQKGEIYFRKKEHDYLKQVLNKDENIVLSTGGGTPCYAGNMDLIKSCNKSISIYLNASINELVNRLEKDKDHRPLVNQLNTKEDLTEFVAKHLFERRPFYSQADLVIDVDDKLIIDLAKEIVIKLFQ